MTRKNQGTSLGRHVCLDFHSHHFDTDFSVWSHSLHLFLLFYNSMSIMSFLKECERLKCTQILSPKFESDMVF